MVIFFWSIRMNPNNNKHFNDEALRINRTLKKENDALKLEIKSLWSDLSELEKLLADYKSEPKVGQWQDYEDEYADKGMSRGDFISKEYT
jgi:hypothetical protein